MRRKLLGILVFLMNAPSILAGGWVIGGGEALNGNGNPWFIQNTKVVNYCVKRDPNTFRLDQASAEKRVQEAIDYWKDEFSRAFKFHNKDQMDIEIATQKFIKVDCGEPLDIIFQLGWLTEEQQRGLGNPAQFIAAAVRTDYDKKLLKGRGFVYVAPDSGPLKPVDKALANKPWGRNNGGLLYRILVHELGHVFGLKDTNTMVLADRGTGIMSAAYPGTILNRETYKIYADNLALPNFFKFTDVRPILGAEAGVLTSGCSFSGETGGLPKHKMEFYGIGAELECLKTVLNNNVLEFFASKDDENQVWQRIGSVNLSPIPATISAGFPINVWLTPEQTVDPKTHDYGYRLGPMVQYQQVTGTYRSSQGDIEREVLITLPLNDINVSITGISDGKFIHNLD